MGSLFTEEAVLEVRARQVGVRATAQHIGSYMDLEMPKEPKRMIVVQHLAFGTLITKGHMALPGGVPQGEHRVKQGELAKTAG